MASARERMIVNILLDEANIPRPQATTSNVEREISTHEETKYWDLDNESEKEYEDLVDDRPTFPKTVKFIKLIVYLTTFCIVLMSGAISKGSLLFMTSMISNKTEFSGVNISGFERDYRPVLKLTLQERIAWIWCLLFILFLPELLTLFRCARLCIFKKYEKPKVSSFAVTFVVESFYVIGIVLLVFVTFPEMDAMKAASLTNAMCIIPSLLNIYSGWTSKNHTGAWMSKILNLAAFIGQISILIWITLEKVKPAENAEDSNEGGMVCCIVSAVLVSCAWWENFVNHNSCKTLISLKEDIEKSRIFIYLFISIWKIVLIFTSVLVYLSIQESPDVKMFLKYMPQSFERHNLTVEWLNIDKNIPATLTPPTKFPILDNRTIVFLPLIVAGIHMLASFVCYSCGKFVCKICIQGFSYALPVLLTVPVTIALLHTACEHEDRIKEFVSIYHYWKCPLNPRNSEFFQWSIYFWIIWLISQVWITIHLWYPQCERMASTNKLFVKPMYSTVLIDQSLALNRRRNDKVESKTHARPEDNATASELHDFPRIYACATMWHETLDEMEQLLKSIMRMDIHQCSQKALEDHLNIRNPDYYEIEAHIFFDDAFAVSEDDGKMTINSYVKDLIVAVEIAASKVYKKRPKIDPPFKVPTPYGGRLIWHLFGDNLLIVHLKNKNLIRHKKRWSQVMYMYYLLDYLEGNRCGSFSPDMYKNTFILALDGDIDFKPNAVQLLVDLMNRNKGLGAACGRIHPVGTGLMVYYQKFEYAIGHWLQKATEHMIGCVLCSPGCFSLFRAEALLKGSRKTYAKKSREAIEYVQFDQGEDRWLCTLLLQRGYRVEYSAASDAYTHCPESFAEFYTQRRRWAPSTMANIMDLLIHYKQTVERNDNISRLYVGYQVLLMISTILGPGTIFLMLVGAMVSAFHISNWHSFAANLFPIIFFILICFLAKNDTQILVAEIFSALYALLMMAVLVGILLQMVEDGIGSPSAMFVLAMTATFIIAALVHPQEFWCVAHGLVYFLSVPSMYLLLALYSFINLHVVSWGTREVQTKPTMKQLEAEKLQEQEVVAQQPSKKTGMFERVNFLNNEAKDSFGCPNLFRCMCCTDPKSERTAMYMAQLESHLKDISSNIQNMQKQMDPSTNYILSSRRRSSIHLPKESSLPPVVEDEKVEYEDMCDDEQSVESEEHTNSQVDNEHWLTDISLRDSTVKRISVEENVFWKELIKEYLLPLAEKPDEKEKVSKQLLELRNKVVFGVLMLNSLFILIVFLLQMQKETLHLEWPFNGKPNITYFAMTREIIIDVQYLKLEPINLVLVFFFTLILVIQFIAMLFHRLETLSHILASTNLVESKNEDEDSINFSQLTDMLHRQGLTDEQPQLSSEPHNETVDTPIQNGFVDDGSQIGVKTKEKLWSFSVGKGLQKLIDKRPELGEKFRRLSADPNVLETLRRRTSYSLEHNSLAGTPTGTMRAGVALLDDGTGVNPFGHSRYRQSLESCGTTSVSTFELEDLSKLHSFFARSSVQETQPKRRLDEIKDHQKKEDKNPVV